MNINRIYRTGIQAQVTFNGYSIVSCTGNIASLIFKNVHVDSAVFCFNSSIAHVLAFFYNNVAAAINVYNGTAGICPNTVSIALEVHITVNCNSTALAVTHSAGCIQTSCTVILVTAVIAFNIQLYIAINNNVALVINTNSIVIAVSSNIQLAVNSQLSTCLSNINTLQAIRRNIFTGKLHFYGISLNIQRVAGVNLDACALICRIIDNQGQSFSCCINLGILNNVHTILVGNFAVLGKFIYSVLNYISISFINKIKAGKSFGIFFYSRSFGFNRTGRVRAFAVFLIEGDVAALQCCGGSSQTVGNLHITGQVAFAVYVVAVGQLACQCVQHVGNAVLVIHCNAGVIGNHAYNGACSSTLDNGIACCVVFCCFTVAGMSVENVGVAAVVADSQAAAVLLEDIACFGISFTADKLVQAAAMITIIALAFIGPLRTVGKQHICFTGTVIIENGTFEIGFVGIHAQGQNTLILLLILNQDVAFNLYITAAFCRNNCAVLQLGIDGQLAAADKSSTSHSSLNCAADISGRCLFDIVRRVTASYGNYIAVIAYIQVNHTGNLQVGTACVFPYFDSVFNLRLAGVEFYGVFPTIGIIDGQAGKSLAVAVGTLLVSTCNVNTAQLASGQKAACSRKLHALDIVDHQIGRGNMDNVGIYIINISDTIRLVNVHRNIKTMALHINGNRFISGNIDTAEHRSPVIELLLRCLRL